jgi:colanic acid biosynthesis glycosyl transferase WcaI
MRLLLLNQYFVPDVAATAQHAADLARELAREHNVTVLASRRASDARAALYPAHEDRDGYRIRRVSSTGFGKSSRWRRAADFASFLFACAWRLPRMGRLDAIVAMTTPPLLAVLGAAAGAVRGSALHVWLMDMNPDEAIAAGWLRSGSLPARILEGLHRWSLRRADRVFVLDRYMRARVLVKGIPADKVEVVPPWSHDAVQWDAAGREAFRRGHGLDGKFVVMYSGNHSPCHPLGSLLDAASALRGDPDIVFCFVGGGSEFARVRAFAQERGLRNIVCLPYQPLGRLARSLSAADLHAVVMGDPFVGIVHPCKIYNVMALGIPVLYIGPAQSHVADLGRAEWLYAARHGDVAGICEHIRRARQQGPVRYADERERAAGFSPAVQLGRMVEAITRTSSPATGVDGRFAASQPTR